jgi:predicted flap endonuclease-1-like 5' DNA nuclease
MASDKLPLGDFPKVSQPALRALAGAGITRLEQLTKLSEAEIANLHGMGPTGVKALREALTARGLSFSSKK